MSETQERRKFDERHASDAMQITVLTGEHAGGAGKAGGEILWTPSANLLAYVDEHGEVVAEAGRLSWLATEEQRDGWIHGIRSLTQYVVRVRRATPDPAEYEKYGMPVPDLTHHFALDEVVERDVHVPELDARLARRLEPVSITNELGTFALDRSFGHFTGAVEWCGQAVGVSLDVDSGATEGSETCDASLRRLEECVARAEAIDAEWRSYAAGKLTELARDWQADAEDEEGEADPEPITRESFAGRIRLGELTIDCEGDITSYYDDDDLFWGHVIVLDVGADGVPTDASIAG